MQSSHLTFESSAFPVVSGEDEATNPGIFGQALAGWMADRVRAAGFRPGEVFAEDFGWVFPVEAEPHALYVVCASTDEQANEWRVFAFAEGGLKARLFGKDRRAELLAPLFAAMKQALEAEPGVRNLVQDD